MVNPLTETPAIAVSFTDSNTREIKALIVGPPDTPYALGFYEVSCRLDDLDFSRTLIVCVLSVSHHNSSR